MAIKRSSFPLEPGPEHELLQRSIFTWHILARELATSAPKRASSDKRLAEPSIEGSVRLGGEVIVQADKRLTLTPLPRSLIPS